MRKLITIEVFVMDTVHDAIFANNAIKLNRRDDLTQAYCYLKRLSYNKF